MDGDRLHALFRTWAPAAAGIGALGAVVAVSFAVAAGSTPSGFSAAAPTARVVAAAGDLSDARLAAFAGGLDPAAAALAARYDPLARPRLLGRPAVAVSYDVSRAPTVDIGPITPEIARTLNSHLPAFRAPEARPFLLKAASTAERKRALRCLTAAVYYEAALEPLDGQRAVAQVVLNRVKHPQYPNSVCGVVFQGWERWTGCQFSFTCDGSLTRAPAPVLWRRAEEVAAQALNGHVADQVGTATHYHADYVMPYWRTSLIKVNQIGAHIFYRWPGRAGLPPSFTDRYAGGELRLSEAVLTGRAARPSPPPSRALASGSSQLTDLPIRVETVTVKDASAPGGETTRVRSIIAGRRQPTKADIAAINAVLDRAEQPRPYAARAPAAPGVAPGARPATTPYTNALPIGPAPTTDDPMPVVEINKPASARPAATSGPPAAPAG